MILKDLKCNLYVALMEKEIENLTSVEIAIGFYLSQDEDMQGIIKKGDLCKTDTKMKI